MKQPIHIIGRAAFLGAIFITSQVTLSAQVASESTTVMKTTTSAGIITPRTATRGWLPRWS